jgi:hypothetical protein
LSLDEKSLPDNSYIKIIIMRRWIVITITTIVITTIITTIIRITTITTLMTIIIIKLIDDCIMSQWEQTLK